MSFSVGAPRNRHAELVAALKEYADMAQHTDRKALQKLAWFLGDKGETEAALSIMEHAKEPTPYSSWMYGRVK